MDTNSSCRFLLSTGEDFEHHLPLPSSMPRDITSLGPYPSVDRLAMKPQSESRHLDSIEAKRRGYPKGNDYVWPKPLLTCLDGTAHAGSLPLSHMGCPSSGLTRSECLQSQDSALFQHSYPHMAHVFSGSYMESSQTNYEIPIPYEDTLDSSNLTPLRSTLVDHNGCLMKPLGSNVPHQDKDEQSPYVQVLQRPPKPQCWDHGCNGRKFSTFSNLVRHRRERSGRAVLSICRHCGRTFTRTSARNHHMMYSCGQRCQ